MRVAGLAATTISICLSGLWAQDVQRSPSTVASAKQKVAEAAVSRCSLFLTPVDAIHQRIICRSFVLQNKNAQRRWATGKDPEQKQCGAVAHTATEISLDCYMPYRIPPNRGVREGLITVEIDGLDERIRELCARAAAAEESEVEAIFAELQAALQEHLQFVRRMTALTLNRGSKKRGSSSSKAA